MGLVGGSRPYDVFYFVQISPIATRVYEWDEDNVRSYVVIYVCSRSLDFDSWLRYVDVFGMVAFFDPQG